MLTSALLVLGAYASAGPANYLFLDFDARSTPPALLERKDIAGFQVIYSWRSLEPEKDRYDFSAIESDLKLAASYHKKLFIQIQDRFFRVQDRLLPDYLLRDPAYGGGLAPQTDHPGEGKPVALGWVAEQWNPNVRHRFQKLLGELGRRFDGRVEGINLPESAAEIEDLPSFSASDYFNAEIENAGAARRAFQKSFVVQYINFWPGEWENDHGFMAKSFEFAAKNHLGVGGPDIVPNQKAHMKNAYPFFHQYRGRLPIVAMAVQEPTLTYINPATHKPFTKAEIVDFATGYLGANVIFWTPSAPWLKAGF